MFRSVSLFALAGAALVAALPAAAQTSTEQRAWDQAQRRYDYETRIYERARSDYDAAQQRDRDRYQNDPRYSGNYNDSQYATNYDAARDYRDAPGGAEQPLGPNDKVYRGSDGRYYCKRSDGTTGLLIGGAAGGILGNVIDGGRNRVAGTLIGGALGAILGKKVDQNNAEYKCR